VSFLSRRRTPEEAHRPARVLTAAGRKIDLTAKTGRTGTGNRAKWQDDAWAYRDTIGEIRYAVSFLRHASSRVRLVTAVAANDNQPPTPLSEAEGVPAGVQAAAEEALARLTGGTFNYSQLLAPFAENMEVAGEAMLVGYEDPTTQQEVWAIRSVDELRKTDRGYQLIDSPGQKDGIWLNPETSYLSRMWHPHARYRALADSPMRALLGPCEELQLVSRMIRAASRSRVAGNGLLLMPEDIDFSRSGHKPGDVDPDEPDDDPFMTELTNSMMTSIKDEGDASAMVPIIVRANAEALAAVRHLALSFPVDEKLLARMEAALTRIGMGLDVPPEIITGVADVNHWSAWQISDSTIRDHVGPLVERMVDSLTDGYLRVVLNEYGIDKVWANRIVLWYDTSPLSARPDRSGDAKTGWDSNVLSDRVLVEALGFDPETDMPTPDELAQRLALRRGAMDGSITEALLKLFVAPQLDNIRVVPPGQVSVHNGQDAQDAERENPPASTVGQPLALPAGPASSGGDQQQPAAAPAGTPGPTTGLPASAAPQGRVLSAHPRESRRLSDLDRSLREQLTAAADAAVSRAVEKAGARVRSAANRDPELRAVVASLTAAQAPAALGQAVVAGLGLDIEALLAGAWDELRTRWNDWTGQAATAATETAARLAGRDPSTLARALQALAAAAVQAWEWLTARLTETATNELYNPEHPTGVATTLGEDPTRAGRLTSVVRGALAIAGGLPAEHPGITTDGVPVEGGVRLGGIATGDLLTSYLRDGGQEIIAYEWVYGISLRHFEPHRAVDGLTFSDFDSPLLANPTSWPYPVMAPGDHVGCHCDAAPVWADGSRTSTDQQAAADATFDDSYMQVLRAMARDDTAAGRTGTSAQLTVAEADRVATSRPSQRSN
jgi:hypothetical protein